MDIVLNSLADEKLQSSVKVLAEHGHFLEIGKFDLAKNSSLGKQYECNCNSTRKKYCLILLLKPSS